MGKDLEATAEMVLGVSEGQREEEKEEAAAAVGAVDAEVCEQHPFCRWDRSAVFGTKSGDSSNGRCDCRAVSCRRRAFPHDR